MLTFALLAILAVLIILERLKKINTANMGASVFMMLSVCVLTGLYIAEFIRSVVGSFSGVGAVIKLVLLISLFIPFAIGAIYIVQSIVRKPLERNVGEGDSDYSLRCSQRVLTLGIISALALVVCVAVMIIAIYPLLGLFVQSLMLFHPIIVVFVTVFTCGLGLFWLAGLWTVMNAPLFILLICFGMVGISLYGFSAILGISACVRAKKAGIFTWGQTAIYGILSLMTGWNFVVYIIMKSKLRQN